MKTLKDLFLENMKPDFRNEHDMREARANVYVDILKEEMDKYKETEIDIMQFLFVEGKNCYNDEFILWTGTRVYMLNYDDGCDYVMSVPRNPTIHIE